MDTAFAKLADTFDSAAIVYEVVLFALVIVFFRGLLGIVRILLIFKLGLTHNKIKTTYKTLIKSLAMLPLGYSIENEVKNDVIKYGK